MTQGLTLEEIDNFSAMWGELFIASSTPEICKAQTQLLGWMIENASVVRGTLAAARAHLTNTNGERDGLADAADTPELHRDLHSSDSVAGGVAAPAITEGEAVIIERKCPVCKTWNTDLGLAMRRQGITLPEPIAAGEEATHHHISWSDIPADATLADCVLWCKTHNLPARECDPVDPETGDLVFAPIAAGEEYIPDDPNTCTCHPDDRELYGIAVCPKKYALGACIAANPIAAGGGEAVHVPTGHTIIQDERWPEAKRRCEAAISPSSSDLVERYYSGHHDATFDEAIATIKGLEAEKAEAYEKGRESAFEEIGNYYLMRKDCQNALAKAQATITALQSELETSHARYLNYDELATAEIKSLQSERDRLKEALEKINQAYTDPPSAAGEEDDRPGLGSSATPDRTAFPPIAAGEEDVVVLFTGITKLDLPAERIIGGAAKANLDAVVIIGFDGDGDFFFSANKADGGEVLWLMELARKKLMEIGDR
jgi:hypothetical protein